MSFSENLQTIRKKKQMSQEELAELLGVSRQAVSKWELGEGYPEVEKLLVLSKKLNISLDSLMTGSSPEKEVPETGPSGIIRIVSPNEGIIMDISKVMRSQEFKGRKNSPKYALFASDGKEMSFWGAQNTLLGWYRNLDDISREIREIQNALDTGVFLCFAVQRQMQAKPVPDNRRIVRTDSRMQNENHPEGWFLFCQRRAKSTETKLKKAKCTRYLAKWEFAGSVLTAFCR